MKFWKVFSLAVILHISAGAEVNPKRSQSDILSFLEKDQCAWEFRSIIKIDERRSARAKREILPARYENYAVEPSEGTVPETLLYGGFLCPGDKSVRPIACQETATSLLDCYKSFSESEGRFFVGLSSWRKPNEWTEPLPQTEQVLREAVGTPKAVSFRLNGKWYTFCAMNTRSMSDPNGPIVPMASPAYAVLRGKVGGEDYESYLCPSTPQEFAAESYPVRSAPGVGGETRLASSRSDEATHKVSSTGASGSTSSSRPPVTQSPNSPK